MKRKRLLGSMTIATLRIVALNFEKVPIWSGNNIVPQIFRLFQEEIALFPNKSRLDRPFPSQFLCDISSFTYFLFGESGRGVIKLLLFIRTTWGGKSFTTTNLQAICNTVWNTDSCLPTLSSIRALMKHTCDCSTGRCSCISTAWVSRPFMKSGFLIYPSIPTFITVRPSNIISSIFPKEEKRKRSELRKNYLVNWVSVNVVRRFRIVRY